MAYIEYGAMGKSVKRVRLLPTNPTHNMIPISKPSRGGVVSRQKLKQIAFTGEVTSYNHHKERIHHNKIAEKVANLPSYWNIEAKALYSTFNK